MWGHIMNKYWSEQWQTQNGDSVFLSTEDKLNNTDKSW